MERIDTIARRLNMEGSEAEKLAAANSIRSPELRNDFSAGCGAADVTGSGVAAFV